MPLYRKFILGFKVILVIIGSYILTTACADTQPLPVEEQTTNMTGQNIPNQYQDTLPCDSTNNDPVMSNAGTAVDVMAGADNAGVEIEMEAGIEVSLAGMETAGTQAMEVGIETIGGIIGSCDPEQNPQEPCARCDETGTLIMPETDKLYPSIVCPNNEYQFDAQGSCVQTEYILPNAPQCLDLGQCQSLEEQSCQVSTTTVVASGTVCQQVLSCEPGDVPEVSTRANGSICNEWGACMRWRM